MASNQYVNKVVVNNETVIDLTEDTIVPTVLRKGFTAHNRSGESIVGTESFVDISDGTDAGPIVELTAKGHAEQFSTTGKNLLPRLKSEITKNGVTFTPNADGSISIVGTSTGGGDVFITRSLTSLEGTYTLSAGESFPDSLILNVHGANGNMLINSTAKTTTKTDTLSGNVWFYIKNAGATYNHVIYPQLELGSTATSYEPYTGGAPSPSPDYPQEIQVARGRNLIQNIFNGDSNIRRNADGSFTVISTPSSAYSLYLGNTSLTGGQVYTLSGGFNYYFRIYINVDNNMYTSSGSTVTFTPSVDTTTRVVLVITANAIVGSAIYPQLTLGSTPQPYVPYGYVGLEAQGKNLYPTVGLTNRQCSLSISDDGVITMTATNTDPSINSSVVANAEYNEACGPLVLVVPNATYTMSVSNSQLTKIFITEYDEAKIRITVHALATNVYTFTTMPSTRYVTLRVGISPVTAGTSFVTTIQLELGTEATDYEPYYHSTTPIPLPSRGWAAGLPDGTADILTLNGAGKVEWSKEMEACGISDFAWTLGGSNVFYLSESNLPNLRSGNTGIAVYCESYKTIASVGSVSTMILQADKTIAVCNTTNKRIYVKDTDYSTASEFNTAATNSKILYPLATPVTEQLGYIDLPDIPEGATLSIPELDALNVRYIVDGAASEFARMWYERVDAEAIVPLSELQSDVAEIATDAATTRASLSTVATEMAYDAQVINNTYAGRSIQTILGTSDFDSTITALHNRVTAANFDGLRIGDYMDVAVTGYGTIRYRIAAFDHYYNCGDNAMPHHIVFVPNAPITMPSSSSYTVNSNCILWNTTNDNNGTESETNPYLASNLHAWEIGEFLPALPSALQDYLKDFRDMVEVRYDANSKLTDSTGRKWFGLGKIWSPSEMEVYGTCVWGSKGYSQGIGSQFPIFRNARDRIRGGRIYCWLRITYSGSSSDICVISLGGAPNYIFATSISVHPLPCFLFG